MSGLILILFFWVALLPSAGPCLAQSSRHCHDGKSQNGNDLECNCMCEWWKWPAVPERLSSNLLGTMCSQCYGEWRCGPKFRRHQAQEVKDYLYYISGVQAKQNWTGQNRTKRSYKASNKTELKQRTEILTELKRRWGAGGELGGDIQEKMEWGDQTGDRKRCWQAGVNTGKRAGLTRLDAGQVRWKKQAGEEHRHTGGKQCKTDNQKCRKHKLAQKSLKCQQTKNILCCM